MPVGVSAELDQCTELVRELLIENIGLDASKRIGDMKAVADLEMCKRRAETAEARASQNQWLATWGLPLGVIGGAALGSIATAAFLLIGR